jgi:D-glycero-alpha-D-manno-heptose-7-phosphate kinase
MWRACLLEQVLVRSAFTVGLLLGLYALQDRMRDKQALAADAIHVEQELLREAVGAQDQVSAAYGGFNRINFRSDDSIEVKRVLAAPSRLAELEQHLALYFTGFARTASEIAHDLVRMTPHRKQELDNMLQLVNEAEAIITSSRSLDEFGRLLHESWQIKRSLTQRIPMPASTKSTRPGLAQPWEASYCAGGGGFMLFYVLRKAARLRSG